MTQSSYLIVAIVRRYVACLHYLLSPLNTLFMQVRHRIDGLEKHFQAHNHSIVVRHRIDGLEMLQPLPLLLLLVRHRIDGLEID